MSQTSSQSSFNSDISSYDDFDYKTVKHIATGGEDVIYELFEDILVVYTCSGCSQTVWNTVKDAHLNSYSPLLASYNLQTAFSYVATCLDIRFDQNENIVATKSFCYLVRLMEEDKDFAHALKTETDPRHRVAVKLQQHCRDMLNIQAQWSSQSTSVEFFVQSIKKVQDTLLLLEGQAPPGENNYYSLVKKCYCSNAIGWHVQPGASVSTEKKANVLRPRQQV